MFKFSNFEKPKSDIDNDTSKPENLPENSSDFNNDAESLLENNVTETNLFNLDESDLIKIKEVMALKEDIIGSNFEVLEKFQNRLEKFFVEISDAYSEEELNKTALVKVLKGEDIPEDVEHLDLEGEYSVQEFLQGLINELDEGIL